MKWTLHPLRRTPAAIVILAAGCGLGPVVPSQPIQPRPGLLSGETVRIGVVFSSPRPQDATRVQTMLVEALRVAYPATTITTAASSDELAPAPKTLTLLVYLLRADDYRGITKIGVVADYQRGEMPVRAVASITGSAPGGAHSVASMRRLSTDSAARALMALVDLIADPRMASVRAEREEMLNQQYAAFVGVTGTASLEGQAFLSQRGGDVVRAAGRPVTLDLVTASMRAWYDEYGLEFSEFSEIPPNNHFGNARRTTVADADGRFRFQDVPPGTYVARTEVTWEAGYSTQGGVVSAVVVLRAGEKSEVILNQTGNAFSR